MASQAAGQSLPTGAGGSYAGLLLCALQSRTEACARFDPVSTRSAGSGMCCLHHSSPAFTPAPIRPLQGAAGHDMLQALPSKDHQR